MEWIYYLLEANLYLALVFGFYSLFLRGETFYVFNRWFLIAATVVALLMPLVSVDWGKDRDRAIPFKAAFHMAGPAAVSVQGAQVAKADAVPEGNSLEAAVLLVYCAGCLLLFSRAGLGVFRIWQLYAGAAKLRQGRVVHVEVSEGMPVFSFFNWLFSPRSLRGNRAIMAHERVHIGQGHSFDLLFFELVGAMNWFNPLVFALFDSAKINHEYIADSRAIGSSAGRYEYARLLLGHIGGGSFRLGHSISSGSQLERRISHLGYAPSPGRRVLRSILVVPMLGGFLALAGLVLPKSYQLYTFHAFGSTEGEAVATTSLIKIHASGRGLQPVAAGKGGLHEKPFVRTIAPVANKRKTAEKALPSELVTGPVSSGGKKRISVQEAMYHWMANAGGEKIRRVRHSIFTGSEAQLFRGTSADTLYVDRGHYRIDGGVVEVMADQLMVGLQQSADNGKKLVVVDAGERKVLAVLPRVLVRTKGMIHEATTLQTGEMDLLAYNMRVQYASVDGTGVLAAEEDKNAPYQPGILW